MHIRYTRRAVVLAAPLLVALTMFVAAPAHAGIDCDLQPTAPICGGGSEDPGGGGSEPTSFNGFTVSQRDEVGAGEFVSTSATIDRTNLMMYGSTHVWTTNWFWGFHGCVEFDFLDRYGTVLLHSQQVCQGVDGTAIGVSDRTTNYQWHLYSYMVSRLASVRIIHTKL
jgi:hypothetical protein